MADKTHVAVLGLGTMGHGMATQLLGKGFAVTVYNRSPARAEALVPLGAKVARTPREAVGAAEFVISMLADDAAARGVWLGNDGALAGAKPGAVLIESSTISVAWAHELSKAAIARGCEMIDAPVTGSKPQAESGQLMFLVGGTEATFARARPVLAAMGRDAALLGPVGSGALIKLINNFMCGVQIASLAQALAMIERSDLDAEKALAILTGGNPGSPMVKVAAQRMIESDFSPKFSLKLLSKDMQYAVAEARHFSIDLTTASAANEVMQKAIAVGLGDKDISAIIELLRK